MQVKEPEVSRRWGYVVGDKICCHNTCQCAYRALCAGKRMSPALEKKGQVRL